MGRIAIIPARGGSKRIPRKNIRAFSGKPMIAWPIIAALDSGVFDEVIVSTDDEEIRSVALGFGASVPELRPQSLSQDESPLMPALRYQMEHIKPCPEIICCVYATAPFVSPSDLVSSIARLEDSDAEFVLAVTPFEYPVQRSLRLSNSGTLQFVEPENALKRSQELEPRFRDAGQFFAGRREAFLRYDAILFGRCLPVVMDRDKSVDIDTEEDWRFAEKLHALRSL